MHDPRWWHMIDMRYLHAPPPAWSETHSPSENARRKQEVPCPSLGPWQLRLGLRRYASVVQENVFQVVGTLHSHRAILCFATAITHKTRILDVVYNASNNELVRTKTLVKNCIIQIDATPFRQWYATAAQKSCCLRMCYVHILPAVAWSVFSTASATSKKRLHSKLGE